MCISFIYCIHCTYSIYTVVYIQYIDTVYREVINTKFNPFLYYLYYISGNKNINLILINKSRLKIYHTTFPIFENIQIIRYFSSCFSTFSVILPFFYSINYFPLKTLRFFRREFERQMLSILYKLILLHNSKNIPLSSFFLKVHMIFYFR